MHKLEHGYVAEPSTINSKLMSMKRPVIYNKMVSGVLDCAFACGAYVAGGFAARAIESVENGRYVKVDSDLGKPPMPGEPAGYQQATADIAEYLGIFRGDVAAGGGSKYDGMRAKQQHGDIDLFFPDDRSKALFSTSLHDMRRDLETFGDEKIHVNPSPSGANVDIACGPVMIQAVMQRSEPIDKVLNSFDITNAKVAFNDKEIIKHPKWDALMSSSELEIERWTSPAALHRTLKWMRKHNLTKLTPETSHQMVSWSLAIVAAVEQLPASEKKYKGYDKSFFTKEAVKHKLKNLLGDMTSDDLVMLTTLWPMEHVAVGFRTTPLYHLMKRMGHEFVQADGTVY